VSKIEKISQEQLDGLAILHKKNSELYQRMAQLTMAAEKAVQEAKVAELEFKLSGQEFQGQIKQIFILNKLDSQCKIDLGTGFVSWPEVKEDVCEWVASKPADEVASKTADTVVVSKSKNSNKSKKGSKK
jgi:hypothetical protein